MKVFISWSGSRSRAVAELMSDWIKCVLQASDPWISTRHIDRGSIWFSEINDKLRDVTVGVVCLTQENKNKPWILFETGALAKGLSTNRICTVLVDLTPNDLIDPLAQFNHTLPNRDGIWQLVKTINGCMGDASLDDRILSQVFDVYWPQFEDRFNSALLENPPAEEIVPRSEEDVLQEILTNTRSMARRVADLEMAVKKGRPVYLNKYVDKIAPLSATLLNMLNNRVPDTQIADYLVSRGMGMDAALEIIKAARAEEGVPNNDHSDLV